MKELLKSIEEQIELTRDLIKKADTREEVEAHIQHLEELLTKSKVLTLPTFQKPYLNKQQEVV
jgi:nucleoid DNA-binding protein